MELLVGGWKPFSLVDVQGAITFTVWACGCNLKCPFCHNWRQAEWMDCAPFLEERFLNDLMESREFVDYVHLTGGEPTLQPELVKKISSLSKSNGVPFSLNTNCTTKQALELIRLADHVAFDVKVPFPALSGLDGKAGAVWETFERCTDELAKSGKPVEIRVPVAKGLTSKHVDVVKRIVYKFDPEKARVVVNPLVGPPLTEPRDEGWCKEHCYPGRMDEEEERFWASQFPEYKVKVKRWIE
ncbi:anaerobic ribonucleoside-triphosphate reductase activating protein [Ignicoccus hospitalis]|uniref:Anaerobic ribonucleoside-triphosphate reductase activating protein n=1 Tax=Ignicoccus hospitalis (strain KIN4/I / DSM 18386 / JCM 14125) TaxID=453591 RepID=A8A9N9_IGNH4|nr:anaerobic ribonucleoside-triphosphate reductase activating protein [Ignicoccus hospitalis]ABU81641.1 anaerobic ribonucleoside-triphosphate reductase activating protein [Ignicoccus hospitalis KIN4/I]HIH89758.1 anaerobic ribonucleoside-triphosphate reductase activating protein [Desulfurococcaceae archaeon]